MAEKGDKPAPVALETIRDVKVELARNYNDYIADVIDSVDARCRKELLLALKDAMALTEVEQKVIELERLVAGRVVPLKRVG